MITKDKITEIFCIADDFCKEFESEIDKIGIPNDAKCKHRLRKWRMSKSEIITIMICFHFNSYRNFKHYYMFFVKEHLGDMFPHLLSYNRFLELEARVSVEMMMFLQICCFGRCTGISFIDSTCTQSAIINVFTAIRFLRIMLLEAKAQWVGILDLNCTLYAMNEGKFSTLCLPKPM